MAENLSIGNGLQQHLSTTQDPIQLPSEEELYKMDVYDVNALRRIYKDNDAAQEILGAREHGLYMRDSIRDNPYLAPALVPALAAFTVGYQGIKAIPGGRELVKTTEEKASAASLTQLGGSLRGIAAGAGLVVGDTLLEWMGVNQKVENE